jgi:hypothetical protein
MKRLLSRLGLVLPLVLTMGLVGSTGAHSAVVGVDGLVIVGSGTISPGLTLVPTNQTVTFSSIAGVGGGAAVSSTGNAGAAGPLVSCTFNGNGVAETSISGSGTATGTCAASPLTGSINCTVEYDRAGPIVVVTVVNNCTATVSGVFGPITIGAVTTVGVGVFVFIPTTVNPTTSYLLAGGAVGGGVNP